MSNSVSRLFEIIEYMAASNDWVSLRVMARELQITPTSTFRILDSLKELGYVRQDLQDSKYKLSLKITGVSAQVLENVQMRQIARPFLEYLTSITNETTHLAILEGKQIVYIDKVDNNQAMRMRSRVGQHGELYSTAVGKSLLAFYPEADLLHLLASLNFRPITEHTIIDSKKFQENLAQIRSQGYSIDDEENEVGIRCIGSPIYDHAGHLAGAVSISGWTITMTRERIPQLAPELIQTCQKISSELGFITEK